MARLLRDGTDEEWRKLHGQLQQIGTGPQVPMNLLQRVRANPNQELLGQGTYGVVAAEGPYAIKFAKVT